MKKNLFFILMLSSAMSLAQPRETQQIQLAYNKTTNIIFPSIIKSIDRGSRDILAQKAGEVENVLQVKAGRRDFAQTNLTVITSDGSLHNFVVDYADQPQQLNWFIDGLKASDQRIFVTRSVDEKLLQQQSGMILSSKPRMLSKNTAKYGINLSLYGIYVDGRVMFYRLHLQNRSNIDYDIESLRFYVADKQKAKRTAFQQIEMVPMLASAGKLETIKGQSSIDTVYALEKFTIPDAKRLVIEMFEQHGGRHLKLLIRNGIIVSAHNIPQR